MISVSTVNLTVSSANRYAPQLLSSSVQGKAQAGGTPAPGISPISGVKSGDAVGNILAIVASMKNTQAAHSKVSSDTYKANAAASIAEYVSMYNVGANDAREIFSRHLDEYIANAPDSHKNVRQALRNGTVNIERLSDSGYETKLELMVQLDENGQMVGSGWKNHDNGRAHEMIKERMGITDNSSTIYATDQATGKNATWVSIGAEIFYITW